MLGELLQLLGAFALAFPLAFERERRTRAAGVRTFPLVAMASCGFVLIGQSSFAGNPDAMARVLYGLMTGIGFIGGGAILKQGEDVHGVATAASLWATGGIGAAVGFGEWDIAIALCVVTTATMVFSPAIKEQIDENGDAD